MLEWSRWHAAPSAEEVVKTLRNGDPPIAVLAEGDRSLRVAVWTLRDHEHREVATRIRAIFQDAKP